MTVLLLLSLVVVIVRSAQMNLSTIFTPSHPSTSNYTSNRNHATFAPPFHVDQASERPIPTNSWWGNLIHQHPDHVSARLEPIWTNPYALRVDATQGLMITYSADHRQQGPPSRNPNAVEYYSHQVINDLILSTTSEYPLATDKIHVNDWDDLGVHAMWGENDQHQ